MSEEAALFRSECWKHFNETGTIFQCSNFAAEKLANHAIPLEENQNGLIVELGAGVGRVTRQILRKINARQNILAFETNPKFCEILEQIQDPRLTIINDCAGNLEKHLNQQPYCVISVLPLALKKTFPEEFKEKLFRDIKEYLIPEGKLVQFQYLFARAFKRDDFNRAERIFGNAKSEYAPPFGWIYSSIKQPNLKIKII